MVKPYIVGNPVPTPEELGKVLGLSPARMDAVRRIMNTPVRKKPSRLNTTVDQAQKKSARTPKNGTTSKG